MTPSPPASDREDASDPGDAWDPAVAWDPADPPEEPPANADALIWRLAYGLYRDHRPHADGFCVTCREFWPCGPRRLADSGFQAAFRPPGGGRPSPLDNPGDRY